MKNNKFKLFICEDQLNLRVSACQGVFRFICPACPMKSLFLFHQGEISFSISLGSEEDWRPVFLPKN